MSNIRAAFLVTAAVALCGTVSSAGIDSGEIVWRTYDRVVYPGDMDLSCPALKAEIGRVDADIVMMDKARVRAETALRTGFDLDAYVGSGKGGGAAHASPSDSNQNIYAKARGDIVASRKVAVDRRNHLSSLTLFCKP